MRGKRGGCAANGVWRGLGAGVAALAIVLAWTAAAAAADGSDTGQRTFAEPGAAVEALVGALKADDAKTLHAMLGAKTDTLLSSGDPTQDRRARSLFLEAYARAHRIQPEGADRATLSIGETDWPLPIPLVRGPRGWYFDVDAGEAEILGRRIGRNELAAIQVALAYVDAQRDYASRDRDGSGVRAYAMRIGSTPGRRDGLYWPVKEGEAPSPLGPLAARAAADGHVAGSQASGDGAAATYHGYRFRILAAQGTNAPGGARDYVAAGRMIGGFALVAWPARYGNSGVMTFIVSHDGVVYEKDLGPATARAAEAMTAFDPDRTWRKVR